MIDHLSDVEASPPDTTNTPRSDSNAEPTATADPPPGAVANDDIPKPDSKTEPAGLAEPSSVPVADDDVPEPGDEPDDVWAPISKEGKSKKKKKAKARLLEEEEKPLFTWS